MLSAANAVGMLGTTCASSLVSGKNREQGINMLGFPPLRDSFAPLAAFHLTAEKKRRTKQEMIKSLGTKL